MSSYAELVIGLRRRDAQVYTAELRFGLPDSDVETRVPAKRPALVQFPHAKLIELSLEPDAYGRLLTEALLADEALSGGFRAALAAAESKSLPLRIRLDIEPGAGELHALRWETLLNPVTDRPLAIGENIVFSRFISVSDYGGEGPLARPDLVALIAVAAAPDLEQRGLTPVDAAQEATLARTALGVIPATALHESGPVTLDRLAEAVKDGPDVLYLVAHGVLKGDGPWLWLQGEDGLARPVEGDKLVARIQGMRRRPRLVVLASCQSAGGVRMSGDPLAALGPQLAAAGVPAVIAMQGDIRVATAETFMARFFSDLAKHGQLDLAAAAGRGAIRERPDWWSPALFMRLKSGRLWYTPGFGESEFKKWEGLIASIRQGRCTAILGPISSSH